MRVTRITPNLFAPDPGTLAAFYSEFLGLEVEHDMGWICFLGAQAKGPARLQIASQGGSETELPILSIEVDNLDDALARLQDLGGVPEYGPVTEPWGVRRFYLRDPAGNLVNVLTHN